MVRLIKRYGRSSRKLYDTEESRYVDLAELADMIRGGQQLKVEESESGEDVTAATLAQVILEGERRGFSYLSAEFLHEAVRKGGKALSRKVAALQDGMDRIVKSSVDRLPSVRAMKGELADLRSGIEALERSVRSLEKPQRKNGGTRRPKR